MINLKSYEEIFSTVQATDANSVLNENIDAVITEHCNKLFGSLKSAYLLPDAIVQHKKQIDSLKAELKKQEDAGETNEQIKHQILNLEKELAGMSSFEVNGVESMKSHADLIIYLQGLKNDK